ncbi:hypothetical protein [Faecalispora anaeroviscerum]|uniref:hypothetical protein n=1 Tax=Faecalispora anaeroviscerum TaxID=2991836 RepID=UPI0024BA2D98|nr:hypothetical protein [Faecalispora anaeroviscerum]
MNVPSRKRPVLLLLFLLLFLLSISLAAVFLSGTKGSIVSRVKNNEAHLTEIASSVIERGSAEGVSVSGVEEIVYYADSEMVEFLCGGSGLGSSTSYSGFYYSPSDIPLGFQGEPITLTKTDTGWSYEEAGGDNHYETEKIIDCWYYYHMSF